MNDSVKVVRSMTITAIILQEQSQDWHFVF